MRRRRSSLPKEKWPQIRVVYDEKNRLFEVFVIESLPQDNELNGMVGKLIDDRRIVQISDASSGIDEAIADWSERGYEHLPGLIYGATRSKPTSNKPAKS